MHNGIQSFYLSLGEEACFFLQILHIAEKVIGYNIDPLTAAIICKQKRLIFLNLDNLKDKDNFLVTNQAGILNLITGREWKYESCSPSYKAKKNEYVINEYTNGTFTHFDSDDFHSLQNSQTIKNGKIISKRVFRIV